MAEDEKQEFSFDKPWNPISYFEEENEAIGSDACQYSPSRLASLFETNISAVDEDITRSKHVAHNFAPESLFDSFNEPNDIDELDHFTLETENGIKVLDTTLEINRKAIFSDFDRLRHWQQSVDKSNEKIDGGDMFINEPSDFTFKTTEENKKESSMDNNIDFLLESLPSVSDNTDQPFDSNTASMNEAMDKLTQIENRLNDTGYNFSEELDNLQSPLSVENADDNLCASGNVFDPQDLFLDSACPENVNYFDDSLLDDLLDLPNVPIDNPTTTTNNTQAMNQHDIPSLLDLPNTDLTDNKSDANDNEHEQIQHVTNDEHTANITASLETSDLKAEIQECQNNTPVISDQEDSAETVDDLIHSGDTNEADAVLAIAANIFITPPTPCSDNVMEEPVYTTIQEIDETNKCTVSSNESDSCSSDMRKEEPSDSDVNIETHKNSSVAEIVNNDSNSPKKCNTTTGVEQIDSIKNYETSSLHDGVVVGEGIFNEENDHTDDIKTKRTTADLVVTEKEGSVINANVCSVQQNEPIQCLTPDNEDDDSSDPNDVETYMAADTLSEPEQQMGNAKPDICCSPLPDVNFEFQTPQCSEQVEDLNDNATATSSEGSSFNGRNLADFDPETDEIPICFVADTSVAEDELDELLGSLEVEHSSNCEQTIENLNTEPSESTTIEETVANVVAAIHNEIENSENTAVVALAATAAPEQNIENDGNDIIENMEGANPDIIKSTSEDGSNDTFSTAACSGNETDASQSAEENNAETSPTSSDALSSSENEGEERRPSLRRLGSTSGPGRRVRFSLSPEYEGENSENADSNAPTVQQIDDPPEVTPMGAEEQGVTQETAQAVIQYSEPQPIPPESPLAAAETPSIPSEILNLGWVAPMWVPDENANNCMKCDMKFTVVKRRHHCRACGKVLCSLCCSMKYCLPYLDYKSVRVCQTCCDIMVSSALESPLPTGVPITPTTQLLTGPLQQQQQQQQQAALNQPIPLPSQLPQAPPPYSEAIDNHAERLASVSSEAPPYSERPPMAAATYAEQPAPVLPAGAHGLDILPSGRPTFSGPQLTEMMNFQLPAYTPSARQNRNRTESEMSAVIMFNSTVTNLPPILRRNNEETRIVNNPDLDTLFRQINDENEDPISFIVNKNLVVRVKVINLDCCVEKRCWCFTSDGMGASNQEELVILIKCDSFSIDERTLARKVLQQMNAVFEKAKHGHPASDLEQMEFEPNMRCMPNNVGMLFFKHSLQCIKKLLIPTSPYLFGVYVERSEMPWAKNFPLRLLLRIGAEFKYYPCPLFNLLNRAPVYEGVGRTILDLLADFRTFQYTIPRVVGVTINLRGKDTIIRLPQHRYDEIMKAVNACEENVLSLAGNFSSTCDGHLVSVEKDGRYKTQTLSIVLKANRKVTCASFIVISAALKLNQDGVKVKASIVEDGVMVQVTSDVMKEFKQAVKDMKEFSVIAGDPNSDESSKVGIEWSSSDVMDRPRLLSPIDGTSFDNLTNMKIRHSYDYTSNNLTAKIHWVEVYFLPQDNDTVQRLSARELGQMTSSIAKACMSALSAHLMTLIALDMTRIGLRVNLAADFVEYKIGANLSTLPGELLPNLDDKLVPAIHNVMSSAQERVAVELIFQVVKIV